MAVEFDNKNTYKLQGTGSLGEVQIADEVVAIIAALATTEVDGVAKMFGNVPNELVSKLGMKNLSKGVKVSITPEFVRIDLSIELKYGYSIPDVSVVVQGRVKNAIENMTGLTVDEVNVRIAGVALEKPVRVRNK